MRWRNRVVAACALALFGACGGEGGAASGSAAEAEEAEPSRGRVLYLVHCVTCHGKDGRLGASGAKMLPDTKLDHAAIVEQITHGKGLMTAFEGVLSPAEIDSVAAYVETMRAAPGN